MDWDKIDSLIQIFNKKVVGIRFYAFSKRISEESYLLRNDDRILPIEYDKIEQMYNNSAYVELSMFNRWSDTDDWVNIWLKQ